MTLLEESLKLARSYLTQGKLSQTILTCKKILSQQPNCAEVYQILGQVFYSGGNLQKAMEAYTKAIEIKPDFAEARAYLGQLYKDVRWWDEAAFQYQKAIQLGLNWPQLYSHLGNIFSNKGDLEVAKNYCEKAIALNPNYINAYFNLGLILHQMGQLEASIKTYQKLLKLEPDNANACNNIGCVLLQLERNDEAIEIYQKGLDIKPDFVKLQINLGEVLAKKEKIEEAIACYRRAIELEPNVVTAHYNLGKLLQSRGAHELAIEAFEEARKIEPKDILILSDLGFSLMALGRLKEAIACWQQTIIDSPFINYYCQASVLQQARCQFYDELDLAKLACVNFIKSLKSNSTLEETLNYWAETYFRFANVFMEYGDYENAQYYYQKVLQVQPDNFDVCWRLGNSLLKQQRYKAAIFAYQITLTILPDKERENYAPTVYYNLGKALEKEERWEGALEYYGKVLGRETLRIKDIKLYKTELTQEKWNPQGLFLSVEDWVNTEGSKDYLSPPTPLGKGGEEGVLSPPTPLGKGGGEGREVVLDAGPPLTKGGGGGIKEGTVELTSRLSSPIKIDSRIVSKPGCYGLNCGKCLKKIYWWFERTYEGEGVYKLRGTDGMSVLQASALPTYAAKVPGGRAWIMPKKSYWMLCHAIAIITPDNYLLADLSRDYPGQLPGCDKHDPTQHLAFSKEEWEPLEQIDGKVAVLSVLSGNVYFHWMADLLPRIEILRRAGVNLDEIDWFLVNNYQSRFQIETLTALGIPKEKILASDRHPHIQAKELIVPSFGSYLGWLQPWGLKFLRNKFLTPKVLWKKDLPERIYISRKNAKYRRVLNEAEVEDLLNQYGFVTISPESMSLEDQIATFATAKIIIAPHGSGLTNIIFCQPGTKVIELISPHYLRYYYWGISQQLGLEHYYLPGVAFSCYPLRQLMYSSPLAEDILVNLKSLKKVVNSIGSTSVL